MEVVCLQSINTIVDSLSNNKRDFKLVEKRGNKYIYENNKLVWAYFKGKLFDTPKEFGTNAGVVKTLKKDFEKYIESVKGIVPEQPINHNTILYNYEVFKNVEKYFYEFDINSCYLQVMYILGYISKKNYEKYRNIEEYKQAYIYAITWQQTDEFVTEYKNGKVVKSFTKSPDPNYKLMYDNIRYWVNNITDEAINVAVGKDNLIKKCIDAIYIHASAYKALHSFYLEQDIDFKVNILHRKPGSDNEYYKNGKLYKIRN